MPVAVATAGCGRRLHDYKHKNVGAVASLGTYQGVAQMFGRFKVRGFLAWVLHRTYHLSAMPTLDRKLKIMAGWTATLLFRREVVALGTVMQDPRHEFLAASVPAKKQPGTVEQTADRDHDLD